MEDDISGGGDGGRNDILEEELERWRQNYIDVNRLVAFYRLIYIIVCLYIKTFMGFQIIISLCLF